jgi:hypothetical protein
MEIAMPQKLHRRRSLKSSKAELRRARDRRYREHRRAGQMAVTVIIDRRVINWLVHSVGALAPAEAYGRDQIAAAVSAMLRASSQDW